ncbi:hypothetical protein M2232_006059 [Bradyrhizobium japonicum]|nr:hypothetical protein [Bradyrhizobium japonicum]MCW2347139.1 hypothetical protein [Bradyrhizobium japonicum]
MPGLVPGIHVLGHSREGVDGRVKPGHDVWRERAPYSPTRCCNRAFTIPSRAS